MRTDTHPNLDWSGSIETLEDRLVMSANPLTSALGGQIQHHMIVDDMPTLEHHAATPQPPALDHHLQREADFWIDSTDQSRLEDEFERIEQSLANAHNQSGLTQVRADYGFDGTGQTVAIIDSGIAYDHFALGGGFGSNYRVVGGYDFTGENDADPYDDGPSGSHGSHVAGIVGASGGTHDGVAPGVDLVGLRVFDDAGNGFFHWVENALSWVHQNRNSFENPITAVNLSLGVATWNADTIPAWANLEEEFAQLEADGIFISVSAGNSFTSFNETGLSYPAASQYVIPVASVDDSGLLSYFSQRNSRVIAAPGRGIISTVPDYAGNNNGTTDDYASFSGTSMAAPYVAGASVIIREAMEFAGYTNINQDTIYNHMIATADTFFDSATNQSYSRLNLEAAVDALMPTDDYGSSVATAYNLGSISSSMNMSGAITTLDDTDYFKFTAANTGTVTLAATNLTHNAEATWDANGNSVTWGGANNEIMTLDVVAGQEYTVGFSSGSGLGYYDLGISIDSTFSYTDWGSISYSQLQGLSISGESWYRVAASSTGYLTVQAMFNAVGGQVSLELYDASMELVGSGNALDGVSRVDTYAAANEELFVKVLGVNSSVDFRLTNLISVDGTTVNVEGTDGNDVFAFSGGNTHQVIVNSTDYGFSSIAIMAINFNGGQGYDSIVITGTTADENAMLNIGSTTFVGNGITANALATEIVEINGGGGNDQANLYDSAGNDRFYGFADNALLLGQDNQFSHSVRDFTQVNAYATAGGIDRAYLFDSVGNDQLFGYADYVTLQDEGLNFSNSAHGFERVDAYASAGGEDQAHLYDSAGDDRFYGLPEYVLMQGADSTFFNYARGFERVDAYATAGGNDRAYLYDSAGNDSFYGLPEYALMQGNESQYQNYARGFERVDAHAIAGGVDRAYLYDSAGNDRFYGLPEYSALLGENNEFFNYTRGFDRVDAYATEGGNDRAYLIDSSGDDLFYGHADYALIFDQTGTFYNYAHGFQRVDAFAIAGGEDKAYLYDSAGDDYFYGLADYGLLYDQNNTFYNKAHGFERVEARATAGGNDQAYLYDSAGDDSFYALPEYAVMVNANNSLYNYARGFKRVEAHATAGGNDHAYFYDSVGNDRFYALPGYSAMLGEDNSFYNYARGFGQVMGYATAGGIDQAFLYDSVGDDTLSFATNHVSLQGNGFNNQANGFEQSNGYASSGYDQTVIDQVYQGESLQGVGDLATVTRLSTQQKSYGFDKVSAFVDSGASTNIDSDAVDYVYEELGA